MVAVTPGFAGLFALARPLLIFGAKAGGRVRGMYRSFAMLFALGAVSTALDALQSLTSSKSSSSQATGFRQAATNPFDITSGITPSASSASTPATGFSGSSQLSPATMSALLAAQSQTSTATATSAPTSRSDALKDLFSKLDADGDGQISKSEFENALGAGGTNLAQADNVFSKLDKNGNGSVTLDEMSSALQRAGGRGHHHHDAASSGGSSDPGGSSSDPLLQALEGATATTVTNSDGSTTTSITNADGSKVTLTTPAASTSSSSHSSSGSASASYNFLEQLIQREAQAISSGASQSFSLSV